MFARKADTRVVEFPIGSEIITRAEGRLRFHHWVA